MTAAELKQYRRARGWTQAEFARQVGCCKKAVFNWEHGHFPVPRPVALAASALAAGLAAWGTNS